MKRFWLFTSLLLFSMLLLFFGVQALHLPFLEEDPAFMLSQEKGIAALLGTALLVADVLAPVPSSIIMLTNGMIFGPFWGALLSLFGGMAASVFGYWLGAMGEGPGKRWMGEFAISRANTFFVKYGLLAVCASRPIPILAEAISIIGGMSRMPLRQFLLASLMGCLPPAVIYAITGAYAVDFNSGLIAFLTVIAISGTLWIFARRFLRPSESSTLSN